MMEWTSPPFCIPSASGFMLSAGNYYPASTPAWPASLPFQFWATSLEGMLAVAAGMQMWVGIPGLKGSDGECQAPWEAGGSVRQIPRVL